MTVRFVKNTIFIVSVFSSVFALNCNSDPGMGYGTSRFSVYFNDPGTSRNTGTNKNIDQELIKLIDEAQESVHIAVYNFSRDTIVDALKRAKDRNIDVKLVGDIDEFFTHGYQEMNKNKISMSLGNSNSIQHNKFALIDDQYIFMGTGNITDNGFVRNNNNFLIVESPELVAHYEKEFTQMYNGSFAAKKKVQEVNREFIINNSKVEVFFSPYEGLAAINTLINLVDAATNSIHYMIFSYTHDELGGAILRAARQRDLDVFGIHDSTFVRGISEEAPRIYSAAYDTDGTLYEKGPHLKWDGNEHTRIEGDPSNGGKMHCKTMIIDAGTDHAILATGSFNWSTNAVYNNDENMVIIHDARIANILYEQFKKEWAIGNDMSTKLSITGDTAVQHDVVISEVGWAGSAESSTISTVATASANTTNNTIPTSASISTGTLIQISSDNTMPSPIVSNRPYYAINVDSSNIKLAVSLYNANPYTEPSGTGRPRSLTEIPVDITTTGSGTFTIKKFRNNAKDDFIELYNNTCNSSSGCRTIDLSHWVVQWGPDLNKNAFPIPDNANWFNDTDNTFTAGSYKLVFGLGTSSVPSAYGVVNTRSNTRKSTSPHVKVSGTKNFSLSSAEFKLRLYDKAMNLIDEAGDGGAVPAGEETPRIASMQRRAYNTTSIFSGASRGAWYTATTQCNSGSNSNCSDYNANTFGTPGYVNASEPAPTLVRAILTSNTTANLYFDSNVSNCVGNQDNTLLSIPGATHYMVSTTSEPSILLLAISGTTFSTPATVYSIRGDTNCEHYNTIDSNVSNQIFFNGYSSGLAEVRINEIAFGESGNNSDYIELYVMSSGSLRNLQLFEYNFSSKQLLYQFAEWYVTAGSYIWVQTKKTVTESLKSEDKINTRSGNLKICSTDDGFDGTDDAFILEYENGAIQDAVYYSDRDGKLAESMAQGSLTYFFNNLQSIWPISEIPVYQVNDSIVQSAGVDISSSGVAAIHRTNDNGTGPWSSISSSGLSVSRNFTCP